MAGQRDCHVTAAVDSASPNFLATRALAAPPARWRASDPLARFPSTVPRLPTLSPWSPSRSIPHGRPFTPIAASRAAISEHHGRSRGTPDSWRKAPLPAGPPRREASNYTAQCSRACSPHVRAVGCFAHHRFRRKMALDGVTGHGPHSPETPRGAPAPRPRDGNLAASSMLQRLSTSALYLQPEGRHLRR